MKGDRLALPVRVRGQENLAGLMLFRMACLPAMTTYSGSNFSSMATPSVFFGRSFRWPTEARTVNRFPTYLLMVFAFDGDSTMISDFAELRPREAGGE
jgi:hypothetical protein